MTFLELEERIAKFYHHRQKHILFALAIALVIVDIIVLFFVPAHPQDYFHGLDLLMVILFLAFMTLAVGSIVIEAVFHVAAGLTVLIFLAESYCSVPTHSLTADDALRALLTIGLLYIIFDFVHTLYRGVTRFTKRMEHLPMDVYKAVILVVFGGLACVFVWAMYEAISPIVFGLCVYIH